VAERAAERAAGTAVERLAERVAAAERAAERATLMNTAGKAVSARSVWPLHPSHVLTASRRHVFTAASHRHPLACWRASRTAAAAARRHQPTCTTAAAARRHQSTCTTAAAARKHQPTCTTAAAARKHQPTCGAPPAVRRRRCTPTLKSRSCKTQTWRAYSTYFEALQALWRAERVLAIYYTFAHTHAPRYLQC